MTVVIAIAVGLLGGVVTAYLAGRFALLRLVPAPQDRALGTSLAIIGALIMLFPAFFLSLVVGGNLGGAWGAYFTEPAGTGAIGVPLGLALGIAFVLGLVLLIGALLGVLATKAVILFRQWRVRT